MTDIIKTYTIERTGRRPLRFTGELIASSDTSCHDDTRWTVAKVYRRPYRDWPDQSETRGYVLAVSHMTRWEGESDRHDAILCDTAGELAAAIEELDADTADELLGELGIVEDLDTAALSGPPSMMP